MGIWSGLRARFSGNGQRANAADGSGELIRKLNRTFAGKYVIERKLDDGGMAAVYLANERHPSRRVALKVLDPLLVHDVGAEQFLREVTIASSLTHPHILPIFSTGRIDDVLYYVMPYFGGESLRARLERDGRIPIPQAIQIALDVAGALDYAHRRWSVIHRDIKPENILLSDHHALVNDFGIARAVCAARGDAQTRPSVTVGTPGYMSPEQAVGMAKVDHRSDLYSLGCVLYEMVHGESPPLDYAGRKLREERLTRASNGNGSADTLLDPLEGALRGALALDPDDRFKTVAAFAECLRSGKPRTRGRHERRTATNSHRHAATPAIAVLPFTNLCPDPADEFFGDGITADLVARLVKSGEFRVPSRTSVKHVKHTPSDLREIGEALRVTLILEGSVRRAGHRVRITAQLIDIAEDRPLWAQTYDRELPDILDIQSEVTARIVTAVRAVLQPPTQPTLDETEYAVPAVHGGNGWLDRAFRS